MGQVQEWLSAGNDGREKHEKDGDKSNRTGEDESEIVKGLVDRIAKNRKCSGEEEADEARPYLDEDLDLPGLDVPECEE